MQKTIRHLLSFGFICILCLIPLSSVMAKPYFTDSTGSCSEYSGVGYPSDAQWYGGQVITESQTTDQFYFTNTEKKTYWIGDLASCSSSQTPIYEKKDVSELCGDAVTITRVKSCRTSTSGSGGVTIPGGGFTNNCTNCVSDTDFTVVPLNPGYKRKITRFCLASKCRIFSTEYTCADGYNKSGDITCETVNYMLRCSGCTKNCTNGKTETDYPVTGYVKETEYTCNDDGTYSLNKTTYKCAKGYYGANPTCNGTVCSGCTRCPYDESIGVYGTTDDAGATEESACHLPVGTYTDTIGTFEVTSTYNYTIPESGQQYCIQKPNQDNFPFSFIFFIVIVELLKIKLKQRTEK